MTGSWPKPIPWTIRQLQHFPPCSWQLLQKLAVRPRAIVRFAESHRQHECFSTNENDIVRDIHLAVDRSIDPSSRNPIDEQPAKAAKALSLSTGPCTVHCRDLARRRATDSLLPAHRGATKPNSLPLSGDGGSKRVRRTPWRVGFENFPSSPLMSCQQATQSDQIPTHILNNSTPESSAFRPVPIRGKNFPGSYNALKPPSGQEKCRTGVTKGDMAL
jgi:hypothetical protein